MGWEEFTGFIEAMNKQLTPKEQDPGSWEGTGQDPWWQAQRTERERIQKGEAAPWGV